MNNELIERVANTIRHDKFDRDWCTALEVAQAVLAELAGELGDAERYRWLRTSEYWDWPIVVLGYSDYKVAQGEELDKAIDEARHG